MPFYVYGGLKNWQNFIPLPVSNVHSLMAAINMPMPTFGKIRLTRSMCYSILNGGGDERKMILERSKGPGTHGLKLATFV